MKLVLATALLGVLALTGCKGATTPIKTLLDDPSHYDHRVVRIAGTVGMTIGALGYGAYEVDDGTGKIKVLSQGGGAPREGAEVGVEGEFRSAFTLGTESVAVIVEHDRRVR